jgi:hypothetical protein
MAKEEVARFPVALARGRRAIDGDGVELLAGGFGLFAVVFGVGLGGFRGVVGGMVKMALRGVGVMRRGVMIASFVVFSGFAMMASCVFVMVCCF